MVKSVGDLMKKYLQLKSNKNFLIYYDKQGNRREFSYSVFLQKVGQVIQFLDSEGIQKGDRILTVMYNKAAQVVIYFAAWAKGVCVVPVNVTEDDKRIQFIIEHSGAKAVFIHPDYTERVNQILQYSQHQPRIYVVGEDQISQIFNNNLVDWRFLIEASSEDEALIVYTSGTTGNPKGVLLQQKNLIHDAEAIAEWHRLNESARMMCVLPIHHVNGIIVTLVTPFFCQGTVVLNEKFSVNHFWERVSQESIHIVSVVPTLLEFLMEGNEDLSRYNLAAFRHFICGAGPLLVETAVAFEKKFKIPIIHGYGLSETTCYSCFLPIDLSDLDRQKWLSQFGFPSIGVAIKYNEMVILNRHGKEVSEGERGEIAIRGETVMKGYDRRPDANAEAFRYSGGWFMSGDEGFYRKDEQGRKFFFITGRMKELIIRGGVNLSPLEIDEVLRAHHKVQYALTVPFENRFYGEEVAAYIVPKQNVTLSEEEIIQHCASYLPFIKQPKVVIFGDHVPYTSTGKPKRIQLKEQLKDHLAPYRDIQFKEVK